MVLIRSHDALFRFVFGEPEQMAELLRSNLPAAVTAAIDWGSLRRLDGSFVDTELQERHADLRFEARIGARPLLLFVRARHRSTRGSCPLSPTCACASSSSSGRRRRGS
jgi:predicted transposase YdaD